MGGALRCAAPSNRLPYISRTLRTIALYFGGGPGGACPMRVMKEEGALFRADGGLLKRGLGCL